MHRRTLCTNAYCLREHIKWENLTHIPTIDIHAQGAWSGYDWRPKNKNNGGFRNKKYEGQGHHSWNRNNRNHDQWNNKGLRDHYNNRGHQNPYPRKGLDNNQLIGNYH